MSETRRPLRTVARPKRATPHAWSGAGAGEPALYVEARTARQIEERVALAAAEGTEAMGLLLGDRFASPAGGIYSVALGGATAPQQSSRAHVRFRQGTFAELAESLAGVDFESVIVGWYHSHLDLGCFMSATDESTQRRYFVEPHQVAWVLDPVRRASEGFRLERWRLVARPVREFRLRKGAASPHRTPRAAPGPSRTRTSYTPR